MKYLFENKTKIMMGTLVFLMAVVVGAGILALLFDIQHKKDEEQQYPFMLSELSDDNVDPAIWGKNFPTQYETFLKMQINDTTTEFGGSLPYSKLIRYPQLTKLWAGYAFAFDFSEERGHYYSQIDQLNTKRNDKEWLNAHGMPAFKGQPGTCMNCHSGWTPKLIREMGWNEFNKTPYTDLAARLKNTYSHDTHGSLLGGTCADCHSPKDMSLRVTRPAYINAMKERGYETEAEHGIKGTRQEMRSHVCQQCHVEYYFKGENKELVFPWSKWPKDEPLRIEMVEDYYAEVRAEFPQDWIHKNTKAGMIKIQHPETELNSSGIHAQAGVACADCHMPYQRVGAVKMTSHHIRSPLENINGSCQTCHMVPEEQLKDRVQKIQRATAWSLRKAEDRLLILIQDIQGARDLLSKHKKFASLYPESQSAEIDKVLARALDAHRQASLCWDFVSSENSTGFHSPQEAQRILLKAIDYAKTGQSQLVAALAQYNIPFVPTTEPAVMPPAPAVIAPAEAPVGSVPSKNLLTVDKEVAQGHF